MSAINMQDYRAKVQAVEKRQEITKAVATRLAKQADVKDVYVYDTEVPGFGLRRTPAGTVLFFFQGRIRGGEGANKNRVVKRTIGKASGKGSMSVAKARAEAATLRDTLAKGIDPADELRARADAAVAVRKGDERARLLKTWTLSYALTHLITWRAEHGDPAMHLKPATEIFYRRGIGYLSGLLDVPVVNIKPDDVRDALKSVGGKAKATKAKRALSGVVMHAIKRLDLDMRNPVSRLDRGEFKPPEPRTTYIRESDIGGFVGRVLGITYLSRYGTAAGGARESQAATARDYILMTLLCGTRREELMQMEWSWISWTDKTIKLPASVTKQKKDHVLPLTEWSYGLLKRRHDARKPEVSYVFPGTKGRHLRSVKGAVAMLGGEGSTLKLHDLRRTLVTHCQSLNIPMLRIKAIVGHSKVGVTENYDAREIEQVRRDLTTYHEWVKMQHDGWEHAQHLAVFDASEEGQAAGAEQAEQDAAYEAWAAQQPVEPAAPPKWPGL